VNYFRGELLTVGKDCEQGTFSAGEMGIRGDYAFFGDEETAAGLAEAFQPNDSRFGTRDYIFNRWL
jgi:hypothetical protein